MQSMMRRRYAFAATVIEIGCLAIALVTLLGGCPGSKRDPREPEPRIDDTAMRIRIANAEARRGGGLTELGDLARHGAKHERLLALRGLGRTGGARAIEILRATLADPDPELIAAAAAAIGLTASLDDEDLAITDALVVALPRAGDHAPVVIEALGRAGDASAQRTLHPLLAQLSARSAAAAAIALGRHGRRKIELADEVRDALALATTHADPAIRYAAVWALSREQIVDFHAPRVLGVMSALSARVADVDPEIRAQAVAALARRKLVKQTEPALEQALLDPDWRVVVEAMRALAPERPAVVATAFARQLAALERGDAAAAHTIVEGLRVLGPTATADGVHAPVTALRTSVTTAAKAPAIARGWIDCLAAVVLLRAGVGADSIERCGYDQLPAHLRLPLLGELVTAKVGTVTLRRAALRTLLAHDDARVRAAGLGALAALWGDGDDADHRAAVATLVAAIGSKDPLIAGSATEAAPAIFEAIGAGAQQGASQRTLASGAKRVLDEAIVARARGEHDVEIASALFGLIGKHAIASGADACRRGLAGHPVLVKAAAECLRLLGETPEALPPLAVATPPSIDITEVVGKLVRWRLATTRGEIVIALRPDVAPWAVATIAALTRKRYYDGLELHRVVPDFVVQGGDPTQSGWGGPGFAIPAEPSSALDGAGFVAGGVGIADAGRDSGGSQWFIMHARAPHLDGRYTWVGAVEAGAKSADALLIGDRVITATIEITPR